MNRLFTFILFLLSSSLSIAQVDCANILNGSALVDDCGDCHQAYFYNYVTHVVTTIDVVGDSEAGPNEMLVLADSPSNPSWNASCASVPGCMDDTACNYNAMATEDDGTCGVVDDCGECHLPYCYNMTTHVVLYVSQSDCSDLWISGTGGGMTNLDNAYSPEWNASCTDCANILNGSALVDDCGDCHQAYFYNYVTHVVTTIDVVGDSEAGPNEMLVLADSPSNPSWNASCASVPGCMDDTACNYNAMATEDDGTCGVVDDCGECHLPYCYNMTTHVVLYVSQSDCSDLWISGTGGGMTNLDNAYSPEWNASCTDCANILNGSALVDDCGDCHQAYFYNYVTHVVTTIDVVGDSEAGPNEMLVLADSPSNPSWNASCASVPGCMDDTACNYNAMATEDDGTCGVVDDCGECHLPYCYNMTTHVVLYVSQSDCSDLWISGTGGGMTNLDNAYSPEWNASCTDCANILNGSALVDDCGDCHQAYFYNYVTHVVTTIDVVGDSEAGPNEMLVLADSPSNPSWNASCASVPGCMDDTACNYNAMATEDDGTCGVVDDCGECHLPYCYNMTTHVVLYVSQSDCSDLWISGTGGGMTNLDNAYSPEWNASCTDCANILNGSALVDDCGDCHQAYFYNYVTHVVTTIDVVGDSEAGPNEMLVLADSPSNPSWNASCASVPGCMDDTACNYNAMATEDDGTCGVVDDCGECHLPYCYNMTTHVVLYVSQSDCSDLWISGTGGGMTNLDNAYSPEWNASCTLEGCTYPNACNYSGIANLDNGSCEWESCHTQGCVYEDAENYHPEATQDDGSCVFSASSCPSDLDQDGSVATTDLLLFLSDFGANCM